MAFTSSQFWLSFFMQERQGLTPLLVAVHLLPQVVAGLIYNAIAGAVLHRINNTLLLVMGSLAYVGSNVLLALMQPDSPYWAFIFPSLILGVVGADFQFNVANVGPAQPNSTQPSPAPAPARFLGNVTRQRR
jgi:hypothetical protein